MTRAADTLVTIMEEPSPSAFNAAAAALARGTEEMQRALAAAREKESELAKERAELQAEKLALKEERESFEQERCVSI